MPNKHTPLTAEELLTETRRMATTKRWRSTSTALNAYREFIDMAMPRMMDIVEQQREQIAALEKERDGLKLICGIATATLQNAPKPTPHDVHYDQQLFMQHYRQWWIRRLPRAQEIIGIDISRTCKPQLSRI